MLVVEDGPRVLIDDLVSRVVPFDRREAEDQAEIRRWVRSGAPLFRIRAPAVPERHLAVYFALLDPGSREMLLVDHVKAGCWLLPGGHVDADEDPRRTVAREAAEELGITARFHEGLGAGDPFFLTVTRTRGPHSHTDVTLWFVLAADRAVPLRSDPGEFRSVRWFSVGEPAGWAAADFDPQMSRFVAKLSAGLDGAAPAGSVG